MTDDPRRWAHIKQILKAALDRTSEERPAFLDQACGDDRTLRAEVDSLLHAHAAAAAGNFAEHAAIEALTAAQLVMPSLMIGQTLAHYRIEARLGAGGMGVVYKARDTRPKLDRSVAIKVLPPDSRDDPELLQRFEREGRTLAALNHTHICTVFDVGQQNGIDFLVMEYIPGETLAERLAASGKLPVRGTLAIAADIADALDAAHAQGIIHRDLKPANIKITPDGVVKVLDFGLAKVTRDEAPGIDISHSPTGGETREGTTMGTAAYMSPEQARGQAVDKRTDIWAFGCVLYELLTGRPAFVGATVTDTLAAVVGTEPDWNALPAATPFAIRQLVRRCLEKDARRRLRDIGDARLEFVGLESGAVPDAGQAATAGRRARWLWPSMAVLLLIATLGVALVLVRETPSDTRRVRFQIAPPPDATLGMFTLSPDGRSVAFVAGGHLWLHSLDSGESQLLSGAGTVARWRPFWSPDSRLIAFGAGGKLKRIALSGGAVQTVTEGGQFGADWSAEDVILFVSQGAVMRVSASGGTPIPLTAKDPTRKEIAHYGPQFLPDGHHFLYLRLSLDEDTTGIYIGSIDAKPNEQDVRRLVATRGSAQYAPGAYDPRRGYLLFNREGRLLAQRFDPVHRELTGKTIPVAEPVAVVDGPTRPGLFSASGTGVLAYQQEETTAGTPVWVDRSGRELAPVVQTPLPGLSEMRLSPDGHRLAAIVAGDVWVYDLRGRPPIRLTSDGNKDMMLWTPDGDRILYARTVQPLGMLSVPADIGGPPETVWPSGHFHPHGWSSDGRDLIVAGNIYAHGPNWDLFRIPVAEKRAPEALVQTSANEGMNGVALSPDARWLVYTSDDTGAAEIWVRPYPGPGAPVRVSPNGGVEPRWARDGRELYYRENNKLMSVAVDKGPTFNFKPPALLFERPYQIQSYDVAPDGRFLMIKPAAARASSPITVILNWTAGLTK
jgi:eukaryotic-like serine/threonine-protein kinase